MRTYWIRHPRDFANEYEVGIATTRDHADQYEADGYERINRASALHALSYRGDAATQAYVTVTVNGEQGPAYPEDVARSLRAGTGVAGMSYL